jgi:hypothetical protein
MLLAAPERADSAHESEERRRAQPRGPACSLIQGFTLKGFTCRLRRCPRTFVNIQPSAGSPRPTCAPGPRRPQGPHQSLAG